MMEYQAPKLYRVFPLDLKEAACMAGNTATNAPACDVGPEAVGGCASGAAASGQCRSGAAAGIKCQNGAGFD